MEQSELHIRTTYARLLDEHIALLAHERARSADLETRLRETQNILNEERAAAYAEQQENEDGTV